MSLSLEAYVGKGSHLVRLYDITHLPCRVILWDGEEIVRLSGAYPEKASVAGEILGSPTPGIDGAVAAADSRTRFGGPPIPAGGPQRFPALRSETQF